MNDTFQVDSEHVEATERLVENMIADPEAEIDGLREVREKARKYIETFDDYDVVEADVELVREKLRAALKSSLESPSIEET